MEYSNELLGQLREKAKRLRRGVIECIGVATRACGGGCSCADIVAALYFYKMRYDPKDPAKKGPGPLPAQQGPRRHCAVRRPGGGGLLSPGGTAQDQKPGRHAPGAPGPAEDPRRGGGHWLPGPGIVHWAGMALAQRLDGQDSNTYVILGDGEIAEGQIWEAAMAAVVLRRITWWPSWTRTRLQATGVVKERFDTTPLVGKWEAFGWNVKEIDGHDMWEILTALDTVEKNGRPTVIIAHTVKGKGVSFAENVVSFHNSTLSQEQYNQALAELA